MTRHIKPLWLTPSCKAQHVRGVQQLITVFVEVLEHLLAGCRTPQKPCRLAVEGRAGHLRIEGITVITYTLELGNVVGWGGWGLRHV